MPNYILINSIFLNNMVDISEDMILNISNIMNDKKPDIQKQDLKTNLKDKIKSERKIQLLDTNKNNKFLNSYSEENELFRNTYNLPSSNNISNEIIFPVKIKKMAKSDIIIKDETPKENKISKKPIKQKKNRNNKKIMKKKKEQPQKIYKCDKCDKSYILNFK